MKINSATLVKYQTCNNLHNKKNNNKFHIALMLICIATFLNHMEETISNKQNILKNLQFMKLNNSYFFIINNNNKAKR